MTSISGSPPAERLQASPGRTAASARSIVSVPVMQVRAMRVLMLEGFVAVRVAVLARHRRYVNVQVVAVIVRVGVFVLEGFVAVAVAMAFGDVQVDGAAEQRRGGRDEMQAATVAEPERDDRAHEGRRREQGAGSSRAQPALGL